ncbi:MAG: hypothetical protein FJ272_15185, partial [Planctomycetes bacterium]|nr:hypothetical protein [Planctomycetota bacterium]
FGELQPRLRAVHHLTGGNPRLALMLYQLCTHTELPEVRDALQALLDDVTPYYKARLEELPPQQRKVMDTFARLGRAATPTELAAETRLPVNQINSILKRLRELGFVALPPQQRRKATYYIVSERVFRIWHQMRFSAASRRKLEFLIEFVRIWYTAQEWSSEADRLMQEYLKAATGRRFEEAGRFVEHLAYLAEAAPEPQKGHELADRTVRACIESGDFPRAERLLEERLASHSAQGDNARLAEDWFLKAYLSYAQGRWDDVIAELGQAVHFKPTFHDALGNWGAALTGLAVTKTGEERDRLFRQAFEKCEAAVKVKPDMHEALNNWGIALTNLAATKTGGERERLFQQAAEKCEAAVKVKPDMHDALGNWGGALMEMASSKTGPEQQRLLQQAADRFEAALKVKPNDPDMLYQWGVALADMGLGETGRQQERLLAAASDKLDQAINISAQAVPSQSRDLWAVQFVQVALARCAHALDANNVGHARSLFIAALDRLSGAEHASAKNEMLFFFRWATHETRADSCAELFSLMRERKMERELALLEPFVLAVEYWQKGKDAQVLDRLNPELRQLVEAIIKGPAAKKEDSR